MAHIKPACQIESMSGKTDHQSNVSFRVTYGTQHTYTLRNPYKGPASEAQDLMRHALGVATQYCKILFRDPAIKAEWVERTMQQKKYVRPDRYCIAEYQRLFMSDPQQMEQAKAAIVADAKAQKEAQKEAQQ